MIVRGLRASELPAITIWQPWASLIVHGLKRYEFRTWPAPKVFQGRTIAIHAGARRPSEMQVREMLYRLDHDAGLTVCGARLDPDEIERVTAIVREARFLPRAAFIGTADLGVPERCTTLFKSAPGMRVDPDKWGWPMLRAVPRVPVPGSGRQGFFTMHVPESWQEDEQL